MEEICKWLIVLRWNGDMPILTMKLFKQPMKNLLKFFIWKIVKITNKTKNELYYAIFI